MPICVFESSDIDLKQRSPLLAFYLCAVAFVIALALTGYLHSAWREVSRAVTMVIAAFAVWSFFRFLRIADERQARINYQALGFAFILALAVSLFWWIREGIRCSSCLLVPCFGVATILGVSA